MASKLNLDPDKLFEKVPYGKIYPLPDWQRFAGMGAVALLILVGFYFAVISGKNDEIGSLQANLAKIQKEVKDNRQHARKLGALQERIVTLRASMNEASKQLPSDKEIPELLEQVSNIGTQVGLEFLTFKPGAEIARDFYSEVPVSMKVSGKFHNMLMFFDEIAHLPRIVTINNVRMESGGKGVTLTMECVATTYRFIEGSENRPATNGKKGKGKKA